MTNEQKSIKGEKVTKYLEMYPNMSSRGLGSLLFREFPLLFSSVEDVRSIIRYYRGTTGSVNRSRLADKRFVGTGETLPDEVHECYEPYTLPKADSRVLLLSDIHFPFHDNKALELAVETGRDHKVNTVILNGDILDIFQLSRFDKEPGKSLFVDERECFWKFIEYLNKKLPNVHIIFKEGNHEERFQKYMLRKAPEIYGMDEYSIPFLFNLHSDGITWVDNKQFIIAGHLRIIHGHEYYGGGANLVNPARWLFLKAKTNAIAGHFHKVSSHQERNIDGEVIGTWSTGCLCGMNPKYMPLNAWSQGFAIVNIHSDNNFSVENKTIINGKLY